MTESLSTEEELEKYLADLFIDAYILQQNGQEYSAGRYDIISTLYVTMFGYKKKCEVLKTAQKKLKKEGYKRH